MTRRLLLQLVSLPSLSPIGCSLFEREPHIAVAVDRTVYVREPQFQRATVIVGLHNFGDATAIFNGCQLLFKVQLNTCWERTDGGASRGCDGMGGPCAPPTTGRMELRPGMDYVDTLRWDLDPGSYRLPVWYERAGREADPSLSDASRRFTVQ